MKYPTYPKLKPSGIQWLGDVPEHWEVVKTTHGFGVIGSGTTPSTDLAEYYDGDIPWVTTSELRETVITDTHDHVSSKALKDVSALKTYPAGSLMIAMYGATVGRLGILGVAATCNQACCVFAQPISFHTKFVFYWLLMRKPILISIATGGGQPNLSQDDLRSLRIPAPEISEQITIVEFLDRETAKIDALVAKKRQLIDALQAKRITLISQTVTRGLPPKAAREAGFRENPPLKPSGIEWLGDVPEHWEIQAIKRKTLVKRGASPRPIDDPIYFEEDGEYSWVRISDVTTAGAYLYQTEQRMSKLGSSLSVKLAPGSLFLSIAGTVGKPCITAVRCCIHDGFVYFPTWRDSTKYLLYIFLSTQPYKGLGKMGTQLNLNTETVGLIKIGIPPLSEQIAIAAFLDRETTKIDALVAKVEAAIEKLQQYRTTLISSAVTGKIDVRSAP